MTVIINGTNGITSVNGTAAAPSVTGTDTDTGIVYGTNTLSLATGGTTGLTIDSTQNVLLSATSPGAGFTGPQLVVGKSANPYGIIEIQGAKTGSDGAAGLLMFYNSSGSSRIGVISAERTGADNSGAIVFTTYNAGTGTEVGRFNKSGILSLAGASTTATGTGIAFPATQSASTDANTLDDYEEGTFTPVLTADGGSGWTYSTQVGKYTKIGNVVHIAYVLGLSSKGTMSGSFYLSGLPFTVEDVYSSGEPWAIDFALVNGLSTSVVSLTGWANNNSTLMQVRKQTAAATSWGNSYLDVVDIGTSFYIQCSCTYRT